HQSRRRVYTVSLHDALPSWRWARRFGGIDVDAAYGVDVAPDGTIYVVGETAQTIVVGDQTIAGGGAADLLVLALDASGAPRWVRDRKSTRLNSSHVKISYAV